jgi:hypothetical protein
LNCSSFPETFGPVLLTLLTPQRAEGFSEKHVEACQRAHQVEFDRLGGREGLPQPSEPANEPTSNSGVLPVKIAELFRLASAGERAHFLAGTS